MSVDLILLSRQDKPPFPAWSLGAIHVLKPEVQALSEFQVNRLASTPAEAWLFWDAQLGQPDSAVVAEALCGPADAWHAGLLLGMQGLPGMIDFAAPLWMLNRDPAPEIEATSWRVSLQACLVRLEVLRQMGFLDPGFQSLDAAGLEWGHRCIRRGVVLRHLPALVDSDSARHLPPVLLSLRDEIRFIRARFGRKWTLWAGLRALLSGYASPAAVFQNLAAVRRGHFIPDPAPFQRCRERKTISTFLPPQRVTVLIPTIERYPYLKTVLGQLGGQTCAPHEIIVIDQTPHDLRAQAPYEQFADLPLKVIYLDQAGQCTSRNAGLQASSGEYILFLDDDDEVPADLIAAHLEHLQRNAAQVSSGVAIEDGLGDLPHDFTYPRVSDVFPTNNSLLERSVLLESGLFDLAYDHGSRADGDLGMRMYLNGSLMLLDPAIRVLHHHAPRGGLRKHRARVITYGSSRSSLLQRQLPGDTEIYLAARYFSPLQVREMLWISLLGTFSLHTGTAFERLLKISFGLVCLPLSCWTIFGRRRQALKMLAPFPQIPVLLQPESVCQP